MLFSFELMLTPVLIERNSEIHNVAILIRPQAYLLAYYMVVRVALWDRCTAVLHPSHNAPRSLFACANPASVDRAVKSF